jgi:hypothetical protein
VVQDAKQDLLLALYGVVVNKKKGQENDKSKNPQARITMVVLRRDKDAPIRMAHVGGDCCCCPDAVPNEEQVAEGIVHQPEDPFWQPGCGFGCINIE